VPQSPAAVRSWSHTRSVLLDACPRAVLLRYHAEAAGAAFAQPDEALTLASRLRHLTTLHQVLGTAIHGCARACITAVRDRRPLPSHHDLLARSLAALRGACASSRDREAFIADPRRNPMLHSVYYRGDWDMREVGRVRAKLAACLAHLVDSALWDELREIDPACLAVVDEPLKVTVGGILVYGAPDLVIVLADEVIVLDWKTSSELDLDSVVGQLATYALVVSRARRLPLRGRVWTGRALDLVRGEDHLIPLRRLDVVRAGLRIIGDVEVVEDLLEGLSGGLQRLPLPHLSMRGRCQRCVFLELCRPELEHAARGEVA
jgi:hypothetical protein